MLDWLGDIGGLIEAFSYLTQFILKPFLKFSYASFVVSNFFRLKEPVHSQQFENSNHNHIQKLKDVFMTVPRPKSQSFLWYYLCQWSRERKVYRAMLEKSQSKL